MVDIIAFGVIFWLVTAIIALANLVEEMDTQALFAVAFWPLTLPVFIVLGAAFAIYSAFAIMLRTFKRHAK